MASAVGTLERSCVGAVREMGLQPNLEAWLLIRAVPRSLESYK